MEIVQTIRSEMGDHWPPAIYKNKVRTQRTRYFEIDIAEREHSPQIIETLLGIELQIGNLRTSCPDLGTARYLRSICRVGCRHFAVPYDITRLPRLADELESAWERFDEVFRNNTREDTPRKIGRLRDRVLSEMRTEIYEIGAGDMMPEFRRSTRQRED